MLINTILLSVAMIAAPAFASHHRRREYDALRWVNRQTRVSAMLVGIPMITGMILFAHSVLSLMSSDAPGASRALYVLAVGQIVNILVPTEDMMLSMTGHGQILRRVCLRQLLTCCVLCGALIPPFGVMGAALVNTICLIQGRVGFAVALRRVLPQLYVPAKSRPAHYKNSAEE
jgi:O-antigen/teichoic acid export membrane protein